MSVVVARTIHLLDSSPMRRRKRTGAFSEKITHIPISFTLQATDPDWDFINAQSIFPMEFNYGNTEVLSLKAGMIIDWDTGVERVWPDKIEQFNLLMTALELSELRTLMSSFFVRAMSALRQIFAIGSNLTLLNNLVVVPTVASIVSLANSEQSLYERALARLRALVRPTKFKTQPLYRTLKIRETVQLASAGTSTKGFRAVCDVVTHIKIKRTGSGLLTASTNVNLLLLSSLTSGWNFDLEFLWDRIPLSFIIDYFFGVGEVLATDRSDVCNFALDACSEQTTTVVKSTAENFRILSIPGLELAPVTGFMSSATAPFVERYQFERYAYPADSQPVTDGLDPIVYWHPPDLAPSQWMNTLLIFFNFVISYITRRPRR